MLHTFPKLFQDPHIKDPIWDLSLPFNDYVKKTAAIIAAHRQDLNQKNELIITANSPFELIPPQKSAAIKKFKKGILLIHGLLDSPFLMQDIGKSLQTQGLLVRSILLPGHGTVPGALLNVEFEDWLQAVRYGIASLEKEVDEIYLGGFSTGGILSLYYTLTENIPVKGIILLAPAFKINTKFDFALNWNRKVRQHWQRAHWLHINKEIDYTKYASIPYNAAYQVYRLTHLLRKVNREKQLSCPIFMVFSYDDLIVSPKAGINYFLQNTHPASRMILYSGTQHPFKDGRLTIRNSHYPDWRILNFSHVSLPFSPDNFHYGMEGDYPLASHVLENKIYEYCALNRPTKLYYDLLYRLKLIPAPRQRLTFNPDYEFMLKEITAFIQHS